MRKTVYTERLKALTANGKGLTPKAACSADTDWQNVAPKTKKEFKITLFHYVQ
jgi:hypothetical protein